MLWVVRGFFVALAFAVGWGVRREVPEVGRFFPMLMAALAAMLVVLERVFQKRYLRTLVAVFLGLVIGVGLTHVIASLLRVLVPEEHQRAYLEVFIPMVALFIIYLCVTIVLQTGDQFRFIVPFMDFSKQGRPVGGFVLDTSAVVDGRFGELMQAGLVDAPVLVPQFVLRELHALADSAGKFKRSRGRRGLENLEKIRTAAPLQVVVREGDYPEIPEVDDKLVRAAKETDTLLVTADVGLARVARTEGVEVVDLHALTRLLRLNVAPGDDLEVELIRPGEESGQAVGYLDDGTMVVVEGAAGLVGRTAEVTATSVIQTSGGRMVFARKRSGDREEKQKDAADK